MDTLATPKIGTVRLGARITGTAAVITLAFLGWYWPVLILAFIMLLTFKAYEVVAGGLVLDATFAPAVGPGSTDMFFTSVLLSLAVAIYYVHRMVWRE
jgi:hypothetical protein